MNDYEKQARDDDMSQSCAAYRAKAPASQRRPTEQLEAIERLREWLKPGDCVYTILRHVSRSGMQRVIGCKKINSTAECELHGRVANSVLELSYNIALALRMTFDRDREGVKISGCGTDMGFEIVYNLARTLWPDGFGCIGEGCRSNDHSNGDRDYTPHVPCDCSACAVCGGEKTICRVCRMCTRCHEHQQGCTGCGAVEHWHKDGGYALQQRWL